MKNILKISIAALASAALLSGCIKETFPTDRATSDQLAGSSTALEAMVKGIPTALIQPRSLSAYDKMHWNFALPAIHLATDSAAGEIVITGDTGYDWFSQWGANNSLGDNYAVGDLPWKNYYTWIKAANDIISTIDPEALTTATKHVLGFAYAYRASFYLDLVRIYEFKENKYTSGDGVVGLAVPIVTETTTEAEAKANPRATAAEVYEKVIFPDLEKAAAYLSDYSAADPYTPSLAMVYGLQARAYLERGTSDNDSEAYKKAAEYARKAITTSGCTPLTQAQWEDPTTGFNSATANNSWIWGLPITSDNVTNLMNFQAHIGNEESWGYGHQVGRAIDKEFYTKIDNKDFRKHSWLDPDRNFYAYKSCRPNGSAYFATLKDYVNIKFRPAQGAYSDYKIGGATDIPCMRVEEMYLIEAEATAQSNLVAARELLNTFMKYRITDGSYSCTDRTPTLKSFIEELITQKRIEFWGEGIIMFDLKRLDMPMKRGYKGTNSPSDYRLNTDGRAPHWNFFITRGEIQNNPAVVNNPDPSGKIPVWTE